MDWILDKSRPICQQIYEKVCVGITSGEFLPGQRLLSVREVALYAGVNPNTVQKAFEDLERRGIAHSVRSSGWYVNEDISAAETEVAFLRRHSAESFLQVMEGLGCGPEQALVCLSAIIKERKTDSHE